LHRKAPPASKKEQWKYSLKTSNTSLRPHIEKHHTKLYLSLVKEHGWEIKLPGLVTQTQSQASGAAAASGSERETFSEIAFNEHLVKFIVVNDQVRSRHLFLFSILMLTFQPSSL
jgi:hypothetical protein